MNMQYRWLGFVAIVLVLVIIIGVLSSNHSPQKTTNVITSGSKSYIDDEIIVRMGCAPEQLEVILGHPTDISQSDRAGYDTWTYERNPREIYSFQNGQVSQIIIVEVNYNEDQSVKIQKDMVDQLNEHGFHFYNTRGGLAQYRSMQYPNFAYTVGRMTNTTGSNNVALILSRPY